MTDNTCCADDHRRFVHQLSGRVRSRYHAEYAGWLRQSAWNQRDFGRAPEMIVRAQSAEDVAETLRFAGRHRHAVSVRAGGHSYGGCFLRSNGILLDISALNELEVDPEAARVRIGPGVTARELSAALMPHGLAFPTGHGGNVALSGFLLGGGMGINSAAWGSMSVFNIEALDLITADGQLRRVSRHEEPDLFWAARGAGPAAFFVVVSFYLKCHPLPRAIANHLYQLPYGQLGPLLEAIDGRAWDARLQIMVALTPPQPGQPHNIILNTLAFTDSEEESAALQREFIQQLPRSAVTPLLENPHGGFEEIFQQGEGMLINRRFRSDNIITNAIHQVKGVLDELLPQQPSPNGITLLVWRGEQHFPDAAYSVTGRFFVSTYLQWNDAGSDEQHRRWLHKLYDQLQPLSCGCYINEFDLEARSGQIQRCFAPENWQRLGQLRLDHDPQGVFADVRLLQRES
ncbi:FAD-binding oxidoreductase [Serratia ficaria]|uniref:FAD-binding oxidoreductase n=1 Tax=Serratia ficaria TaxID=61651 RepID=UPI002183493C|nr:FAD-binding oxidoreductase [Serratia ficaria]CAI1860960.1 6-hydroxy-D-nicotine oxidase [Serratia ficaria]